MGNNTDLRRYISLKNNSGNCRTILVAGVLIYCSFMCPGYCEKNITPEMCIDWLRKVPEQHLKRCLEKQYAQEAEFCMISSYEKTEDTYQMLLRCSKVDWNDQGKASTKDVREYKLLLSDLKNAEIVQGVMLPPEDTPYPGFWTVTVKLGSGVEAVGNEQGMKLNSLVMTFDSPYDAHFAARCWKTLMIMQEGGEGEQEVQRRCLFVDEAEMIPSFSKFRRELLVTVSRRDFNELLKCLSPEIEVSFGGDGGIEEFIEAWKGGSDPDLWDTLQEVLDNGGSFTHEPYVYAPKCLADWEIAHGYYVEAERSSEFIFMAPYWFFAPGDGFDDTIMKHDKVAVRKEPRETAEIVAALPKDVLVGRKGSVDDLDGKEEGWEEISEGELHGFVKSGDTRRIIDYRIGFKQDPSGEWKIVWMVAGD